MKEYNKIQSCRCIKNLNIIDCSISFEIGKYYNFKYEYKKTVWVYTKNIYDPGLRFIDMMTHKDYFSFIDYFKVVDLRSEKLKKLKFIK